MYLPLTFLFIFISSVAFSQDIESLENKFNESSTDSARFWAAMNVHNSAFNTNPPKSKFYADKMLEIAQKFNTNFFYYRAYNALGRCERKKRNYSEVLKYDSLWLVHSEGLSDSEKFIIYSSLVNDYADNEQYAQSELYFPKAMALALAINKPEELGRITYSRGMVLLNQFKAEASKPYFRQSIANYLLSGNEAKRRGSEVGLGEGHLNLGENDSALQVLSSAYGYYAQTSPKAYRFAYLNGLLGSTYYRIGNVEAARKSFSEARSIFKEGNNFPDYALVGVNLAALELDLGHRNEAKMLLQESEKLSEENEFELGLMETYFGWAKYYSAQKQFDKADQFFEKSARLMQGRASLFLKTEWKKAKAAHFYRQMKYKEANELMFDYAASVASQRDKKSIVQEIKKLSGNGQLVDSASFEWLKLLFSPGGVQQVKKLLKNRPLNEVLKADSLLVAPLNKATIEEENLKAVAFSRQMQEMESKYKAKALQDSLGRVEVKEKLAQEELKSNQYLIGFLGGSGVLLFILMGTQFYYRRKAEKARAYIALLKQEAHHRVKNNLNMINYMLRQVEQKPGYEFVYDTLVGRINSIKQLHALLQQGEVEGFLAMQPYLEAICGLQSELRPELDIVFQIQADIKLLNHKAEDLGLIVNELVNNSIKHAFDNHQHPEIQIRLSSSGNRVTFQYADNGSGMPETFTESFGLKLIKGNSMALGGNPEMIVAKGFNFNIEFPA